MASTVVDSPSPSPSFDWLSPRISFSFEIPDPPSSSPSSTSAAADPDFEFHPSSLPILPSADELISDGVLLPLPIHIPPPPPPPPLPQPPAVSAPPLPSAPSPKPPRCSARLRELLSLRRKPSRDDPKPSAAPKPLRCLLRRNTLPSPPPDPDPSSVPLLCDSSSREPELPRHSLDSDKPSRPPRVRIARAAAHNRGASVDSPRMDPSGRIVYGSLERSSSSPGSFGGPNPKTRPIQRSYSANVRVAPVLNLFGFNPLLAATKREAAGRRRKAGGD